jgi:hypothetical protein
MLEILINNICLVDVFLNIQSAFLWMRTVILIWPNGSFYWNEADFIQGIFMTNNVKRS